MSEQQTPRKLTRRDMLRLTGTAGVGILAAACGGAEPQVIEVEKQVVVEKEVVTTVEVEKIVEKEIMVYLFCTNKLAGDDHKRLWYKKKFKPPYKGVTKLDKRVDANLKLVDSFLEKGVPKNQIINSAVFFSLLTPLNKMLNSKNS